MVIITERVDHVNIGVFKFVVTDHDKKKTKKLKNYSLTTAIVVQSHNTNRSNHVDCPPVPGDRWECTFIYRNSQRELPIAIQILQVKQDPRLLRKALEVLQRWPCCRMMVLPASISQRRNHQLSSFCITLALYHNY